MVDVDLRLLEDDTTHHRDVHDLLLLVAAQGLIDLDLALSHPLRLHEDFRIADLLTDINLREEGKLDGLALGLLPLLPGAGGQETGLRLQQEVMALL